MNHSLKMGEKKISKLLIEFSVPAIIGMVVSSLYNVVDRIFVGNSTGTLGIAGITISFPIQLIAIAFVLLISMGANSLISIKLGEGKHDEAEQILGNAFSLITIISLVLTVIGLIYIEPILKIFGASNEIMPYAKNYLKIILLGNTFLSYGFGLIHFLRGEGNSRIATAIMLAGALLNFVLDPIFIFGLKMGIKGAALATILAQAVSGIWALSYFLSKSSVLKIHKENLIIKKDVAVKITSLGFGQFVMELATSIVSLILNRSLIQYGGDMAISGMGIVTSIQALILMPLMGINMGLQPIVGYNFGAQKMGRVKEALKLAIIGGSLISIIGFIIVQLFPSQLVSLFSKNDEDLMQFTVYALRVFLLMLPVLGVQVIGSNFFMAVGKPKPAAILSLSRQFIIFIPVLLVLPKYLGLNGIVIAGALSDFLAFIFTGIWLSKYFKDLNKKNLNTIVETNISQI